MQKIEALKLTIYNLENDVYEFCWIDFNKCNCGVLARSIMGGTLPGDAGYFNAPIVNEKLTDFASRAYCMTSNLPLPRVFQELKNAGFSDIDILELENMSNERICDRIGESWFMECGGHYKVGSGRGNKNALIRYLKAWVEILEEETIGEPPVKETPPAIIENKTQIQYIQKVVQVPSTLNEQVKQVIQIAEITS